MIGTQNDVWAVTRTIFGEARGAGALGMYGVACVISNRLQLDTWFGDTWSNVCMKPFQFSCWNDDDPNRSYISDYDEKTALYNNDLISFKAAQKIAYLFCQNNGVDVTMGSTHYYDNSINLPQSWAKSWMPTLSFAGFHFGIVS